MTIADTDVLIDYLAGKGEAEAVESLLRRGVLRTTVVSRFELLSGARSAKQLAHLVQFLSAVPALVLDEAAADAASEIRRSLDRTGNAIGMADSLIAGIVISNGAALLTAIDATSNAFRPSGSPDPPPAPQSGLALWSYSKLAPFHKLFRAIPCTSSSLSHRLS